MKAIGYTLAIEVMAIAERKKCGLRWESDSKQLLLETRHDRRGYVAGAIAAAEAIEAETCEGCRGPGRRRRKSPRGRVRTRCGQCAAPGENPIDTTWMVPVGATMTSAEAAAGGWSEPDKIVRLRCCGWEVNRVAELMNHVFEIHDSRGATIHRRGGWNHLARALLRLVLANQKPNGWQLRDLKEKWGHISAICQPGTNWRYGALALFSAMSGKTCSRCGRPGTMRDHRKQAYGVLPLCDGCETQWRRDEETPDGHLRRMISDRAAAEGREIDVDAEVARVKGKVFKMSRQGPIRKLEEPAPGSSETDT